MRHGTGSLLEWFLTFRSFLMLGDSLLPVLISQNIIMACTFVMFTLLARSSEGRTLNTYVWCVFSDKQLYGLGPFSEGQLAKITQTVLREHSRNVAVIGFYMKKVKVKFNLEQAMKAQRGSRNMTVLVL